MTCSSIIWLASYPKSGNTWFRIFVSNLRNERGELPSVSNMDTDGIFSSRATIDTITGIKTSYLTHDESDLMCADVFSIASQRSERDLYVKVHNAYTYLPNGRAAFEADNAKAVCIIRNPLDLAVSFANHLAKDIDTVISLMENRGAAMCHNPERLHAQLRQKLMSWSEHVESWITASEIPVCVLRYEDMKLDAFNTFSKAVRFIGLDVSDSQISDAIERSDFKKLKEEENQYGFSEKPSKSKSFFRKGEIGDWRNHLTDSQRDRIISVHGDMMEKLGYIVDNKLVF